MNFRRTLDVPCASDVCAPPPPPTPEEVQAKAQDFARQREEQARQVKERKRRRVERERNYEIAYGGESTPYERDRDRTRQSQLSQVSTSEGMWAGFRPFHPNRRGPTGC